MLPMSIQGLDRCYYSQKNASTFAQSACLLTICGRHVNFSLLELITNHSSLGCEVAVPNAEFCFLATFPGFVEGFKIEIFDTFGY